MGEQDSLLDLVWNDYRGLTALIIAFGAGGTVIFSLMPWLNAFSQVQQNTMNIGTLDTRVTTLESEQMKDERRNQRLELGLRMLVCDSPDAKNNDTVRTFFGCSSIEDDMAEFRFGPKLPDVDGEYLPIPKKNTNEP